MSVKKTVLIVYKHFFPGFRAGGPIQSLVNMVTLLNDHYQFYVITSAFDMNSDTPYEGISPDQWLLIDLQQNIKVKVWYNRSPEISLSLTRHLISEITPDVVFINGLFTSFSTNAMRAAARTKSKVVISPRGMLQHGAISSKRWKKKIYLNVLKFLEAFKNAEWHATNEEEKTDIFKHVDRSASVRVVDNIPKKPVESFVPTVKKKDRLRLVYLSLIAEKKNLLLLIQALQKITSKTIVLDIYGPVKDQKYWQQCTAAMVSVPSNNTVAYKGTVAPQDVQNVISGYDALISLTKGENFGHALFESLSVGRPLITSEFTPWKNLSSNSAGWNVDIADDVKISVLLHQIAELDSEAYKPYCEGAFHMALTFFETSEFELRYKQLFG